MYKQLLEKTKRQDSSSYLQTVLPRGSVYASLPSFSDFPFDGVGDILDVNCVSGSENKTTSFRGQANLVFDRTLRRLRLIWIPRLQNTHFVCGGAGHVLNPTCLCTTTYSLIKLHSFFASFSRVATDEVADRRSLESRLQKSKERWLLICVIWRSGGSGGTYISDHDLFLFQQVLDTTRTCQLKFSWRQLLSTTRFHVFGNLESQLHLFTNVTQRVYCENHVAALSTTSIQRNPDNHYRSLIWKGSTLPGWICKLQSTNKYDVRNNYFTSISALRFADLLGSSGRFLQKIFQSVSFPKVVVISCDFFLS